MTRWMLARNQVLTFRCTVAGKLSNSDCVGVSIAVEIAGRRNVVVGAPQVTIKESSRKRVNEEKTEPKTQSLVKFLP